MGWRDPDGQPAIMPTPAPTPPSPDAAVRSTPAPTGGGTANLLLTRSEYDAREQELERLRKDRDEELPRRLREARTYVTADAVEEIGQIQEQQTVVDARIARLEQLLAEAKVTDDRDAGVVTLGCSIEVLYRRTGRQASYRLNGVSDGSGCISSRSPVGSALIGRRAGDLVTVELPDGRTEQIAVVRVTPPGGPGC